MKSPSTPHLTLMEFDEVLSDNVFIKKWEYWKFYHFIICDSVIMTTLNMDLLAWIPNHKSFCHFETGFIQPFLIGNTWNLDWQLHTNFKKKLCLAKYYIKNICGIVLKLLTFLLWCFSFFFQRAINWQGKIQIC